MSTSTPDVTGVPVGIYPLLPYPSGRPRFGLVSAGSVGDCVMVFRSLRAAQDPAAAFVSICSVALIAGPAVAPLPAHLSR